MLILLITERSRQDLEHASPGLRCGHWPVRGLHHRGHLLQRDPGLLHLLHFRLVHLRGALVKVQHRLVS